MSILSDAELADLWATYAAGLPETCRLYAPVESGSAGTITDKTWPTITSTVACAILEGPSPATSGANFDNANLVGDRSIQFPRGTTVDENWHVIPTTGRWAGTIFETLTVEEAGTYGPATSCQVVKVQP